MKHTLPSWSRLADTVSGARVLATKLAQLGKTALAIVSMRGVDQRLARLHARGHIDVIPTRIQLVLGSIDMVRFWIKDPAPVADHYCQRSGRSMRTHLLLRFLDAPASNIDPSGLASQPESIIRHLLQVVHPNPLYDLQLLDAHAGGLDALESQLRALLAGRHPDGQRLAALVERPDYHGWLLSYLCAFRFDPDVAAPLREDATPELLRLDRIFGQLPTTMRYFAGLPTTAVGAIAHLLTVKRATLRTPRDRFSRSEGVPAILSRAFPTAQGRALSDAERATLRSIAEVILEGSPVAIEPAEVADNVDRFLALGRSRRAVSCRALLRLLEWLPVSVLGRRMTRLSLPERRRIVTRYLARRDGLWWLCSKVKYLVLIGAYGDARAARPTGFVPVPERPRFRNGKPIRTLEIAS